MPTPDDYIGRTIETDGTSHRIESVRSIGSRFVVFELRNLESGEIDRVLKVSHDEFDPIRPLVNGLREAAADLERNPDRVIRICDRWLALRPTEEAAAFNKGVAHLEKNELRFAREALDLAVSLAPRDLWNLIHRASCLARMSADRECVRDVLTALDVDGQQFGSCLARVPGHGAAIRRALKRSLRAEPSNQRVRQVLRDSLGPSFRLRSAVERIRAGFRRR